MTLNRLQIQVTVGVLTLNWRDCPDGVARVSRISWSEKAEQESGLIPLVPGSVVELAGRLARYFETGSPVGELPWDAIDQELWSPFQRAVYTSIAEIPYGETRTYGWVARKIGKYNATRAVGQALRKNPLPILIPCHRVVSLDSLGGFMGCSDLEGPEMRLKTALISIEDSYRQPIFPLLAAV